MNSFRIDRFAFPDVVTRKVKQNFSATLLTGKVLLDKRPFDSTEGAKSFRFR